MENFEQDTRTFNELREVLLKVAIILIGVSAAIGFILGFVFVKIAHATVIYDQSVGNQENLRDSCVLTADLPDSISGYLTAINVWVAAESGGYNGWNIMLYEGDSYINPNTSHQTTEISSTTGNALNITNATPHWEKFILNEPVTLSLGKYYNFELNPLDSNGYEKLSYWTSYPSSVSGFTEPASKCDQDKPLKFQLIDDTPTTSTFGIDASSTRTIFNQRQRTFDVSYGLVATSTQDVIQFYIQNASKSIQFIDTDYWNGEILGGNNINPEISYLFTNQTFQNLEVGTYSVLAALYNKNGTLIATSSPVIFAYAGIDFVGIQNAQFPTEIDSSSKLTIGQSGTQWIFSSSSLELCVNAAGMYAYKNFDGTCPSGFLTVSQQASSNAFSLEVQQWCENFSSSTVVQMVCMMGASLIIPSEKAMNGFVKKLQDSGKNMPPFSIFFSFDEIAKNVFENASISQQNLNLNFTMGGRTLAAEILSSSTLSRVTGTEKGILWQLMQDTIYVGIGILMVFIGVKMI